jgi:pimeloyl-ACP methyl ester carboxylesterase
MQARLTPAPTVAHRTVTIDGLDIFYREAGLQEAPTVLLLHEFPTSAHMFRHLIPALADEFHLAAPDYPGFGYSSAPPVDQCLHLRPPGRRDRAVHRAARVNQVHALRAGLWGAGWLPTGC